MKSSSTKQTIASIACIVLVAVVIGFLLHRKVKAPTNSVPVPAQTALDWNTELPDAQTALAAAFPNDQVASRSPISIVDTGDVDGDGVPEALVDMGTGGASTDSIALVSFKNGQVTVASSYDPMNGVMPMELVQGSSVLHSEDVGMDPTRGLVYQEQKTYSTSDGSLETCSVDEYTWDPAHGYYADKTLDAVTLSDPLWVNYCGGGTDQ